MSPVSNTSACQGARVESNLPDVAPETNAYAISPSASSARPAPCLRSKSLSTEVGNPTSLHTEVGLGPGAGLALPFSQSCCQRRIASLNPVASAGLPRCTTSSLGLEPFLPEHSLVTQDEGQAACEERLGAPSGRPGHAPASSCHSSSCCGLGRCREDRHICAWRGRARR